MSTPRVALTVGQINETFDRTEPHASLRDVAKLYRGESLTKITSPHNLVVLYSGWLQFAV